MKIKESIETTISCLDTEDLADKAYSGLMATMSQLTFKKDRISINSINGGRGKDYSSLNNALTGIYIPGSKRNYWAGFVDPSDWPLPENGSVYVSNGRKDSHNFVTIKQINSFPRGGVCALKKPAFIYKVFYWEIIDRGKGNIQRWCIESYFAVSKEGDVYTVIDKLKLRDGDYHQNQIYNHDKRIAVHFGPGALSILADRRYLWNIQTVEPIKNEMKAIVNFGVEQEMIKSLLFARDEPLTATGRKRPILHWVKSHKRRIQNKIDIDIKKHLRGIEAFKIGDLAFNITEPTKHLTT